MATIAIGPDTAHRIRVIAQRFLEEACGDAVDIQRVLREVGVLRPDPNPAIYRYVTAYDLRALVRAASRDIGDLAWTFEAACRDAFDAQYIDCVGSVFVVGR